MGVQYPSLPPPPHPHTHLKQKAVYVRNVDGRKMPAHAGRWWIIDPDVIGYHFFHVIFGH